MESHGAVRVDWDREATAVGGVAVARKRQRQFFRSADDQSSSRPAVSFLDITCISSRVDVKAMTALLKGGSLEQAHSLVGLQCNVAPAWSQKVLELTAPHLKGLQAVSPLQRHLDRILVMPHLQALCLTNVTGQQARQVSQMASLRRLELHCPLDAPLPELLLPRAVPPAGLRWLRCGVEPLVTALALVQAHASTLEELQLVTASVDPAGCPDLVTELKRCSLKNLHRVVLLRHTAYGEQCRHDHPSCKDQLQRLWLMFGESDLFADILCSECDKAELSKSGP
ncbi:uncharacterized protein LOC117645790 [Thrips palmi]|uniref:Uncharacterized protein LOC117645790 n=1 Tax=Thrips palmi TaxID=161013 RepID=A0A6P8YX05_THRPL|nr:uncharacterized protein LOC117645790 [Thrips palmi]